MDGKAAQPTPQSKKIPPDNSFVYRQGDQMKLMKKAKNVPKNANLLNKMAQMAVSGHPADHL